MKIRTLGILLMIGITFTLTGCGGGGGGGGGGGAVDQAPSITTQPSSLSLAAGNNTTFSVTAAGTALTYQWQTDTGSGTFTNVSDAGVFSGSNTATLTLTGITAGMNGSKFRVVVSGSVAPAVTSSSATLTVTAPTSATLTLGIPSLPANTLVSGIQFTINLPNGVTPAVFTGNDATGSTTLTGGATGSFGGAGYNAVNNTITFGNITLNSFGAGNFLLVNCSIAQGSTVTANNFSVSNVQLLDANGVQIPNASISIAAQFL